MMHSRQKVLSSQPGELACIAIIVSEKTSSKTQVRGNFQPQGGGVAIGRLADSLEAIISKPGVPTRGTGFVWFAGVRVGPIENRYREVETILGVAALVQIKKPPLRNRSEGS